MLTVVLVLLPLNPHCLEKAYHLILIKDHLHNLGDFLYCLEKAYQLIPYHLIPIKDHSHNLGDFLRPYLPSVTHLCPNPYALA